MGRFHKTSQSSGRRLFVALPVSAEILDRLLALQGDFQHACHGLEGRWTTRDQMHVTLKFLGFVPEVDMASVILALHDAARGQAPLVLQAEGLGFFPHTRRPRVGWVRVVGDLNRLRAIHRRIDLAMARWAFPEDRDFVPHLTLVRIGKEHGAWAGRLEKLPDHLLRRDLGTWQVSTVELIESQLSSEGACYQGVATARLEPA